MTDILFILKIYKCLLCNNNTITRNNNVLLTQFLKEIQKRKILLDFVKQLLFVNCFLKNFYQKHCRQVEKKIKDMFYQLLEVIINSTNPHNEIMLFHFFQI